MAEILTRTYSYTGVSSWTVGESAVALSSFTVSGDTRPITQILSISASWYRLHSTSSTVAHAAELVFGDGSVLRSNSVSKRGDNERFQIETSFMDMPGAAAWVASSITLRTTLSTKLNHVYWRATADQPMVLTITYISSEFKPYITNAKLYRANSLGAAADDGTYLSFTAKLAVEKLGTGGSGTFKIYSGDSADATTTQVYSRSVSGSTSGVTISSAPISGVTIGSGVKKWYRIDWLIDHAMNFSQYGADAQNWVVSFHSHTLPYSDRWIGYEGEDGELGGYKVYDAEKGNAADTSEFHGYGWDNHELRKLVHAFQYGQQLDFKKTVIDVDDENDGVTDHRWISYERSVDFTQQGAMKVLGWFAGHCHADCHATVYGLNLSISTCTCASQRKDWSLDPTPSKPAPERNSTDLAMSVNVFVVNLDERKINVVKVGSKADNSVSTSSDYEIVY